MNKGGLYTLALLVLIADQVSKHWVTRSFLPGESHDIVPGFFALTFERNTGGAFSIFQHSALALAVASVLVAGAIILFTARSRMPLTPILAVALALALGGALGNLIDRLRLRYVVDFLDLHVGVHQWPVFNIADSAICIGVGLLVLRFWILPANDRSGMPVGAAGEPRPFGERPGRSGRSGSEGS